MECMHTRQECVIYTFDTHFVRYVVLFLFHTFAVLIVCLYCTSTSYLCYVFIWVREKEREIYINYIVHYGCISFVYLN